ncbi:GRIP and coiled-coil domain-containing protein 2 isoform X2 [Oopsacas minuta]|uniref:GRIP and coiled-coil domain-containing protein 2 isoform X2 n=1 Tax=Oopsacas minuta TaxID=111878 RepID=A0AAV7KGL7_9METZ|nr:GRIP and coiled-coil domain-containing protein 2 isoform X2 [Oopsacas minuta]
MSNTEVSPGSANSASPQSATSKLDTLSREDLIKFVKKQAVTIKSLRNKDSIEQATTSKSSQLDLSEEYSVLKSEKDVLFQKFSALSSEKNTLDMKYEQSLSKLALLEQEQSDTTGDVTNQEINLHSQIKRLQLDLSKSENENISLKSKLKEESNECKEDKLEASEQKLRLLDLELADYQTNSKLLAEENTRIKDKLRSSENKIKEDISDREAMLKQITNLESGKNGLITEQSNLHTQIREYTTGAETLRAELDKEKKSLEEVRGEMEQMRYNWEEDKLHNQELEIKIHKIEQSYQIKLQDQVDAIEKLEQNCSDLESKLIESQIVCDTSVSEYENYKIRVHGVLKQKSELVSSSQQLKDKILSLETDRTELYSQLEKKDKLISTLEGEVATLRRDLTLEEEGRSISEKASLSRVESLQTSKNEQINRQLDEIHNLHEQLDNLKLTEQQMEQSYAYQLQSMQRDHQEKMTSLQQENLRLQNIIHVDEGELLPPCGLQERTQGEGMEREVIQLSSKPDSTAQSPTGSGRGFYLERLLTTGPEEVLTTPEPVVGQSLLQEVTTSKRQLRHLNEILHESESSNMLLEQQVKLLKEEIRRLERNTERGKHLESLEYLKNVVVSFFSSSSNQADMLPALRTVLQLGPEEIASIKSEITAVARMKKLAANSASFAWSSYDATNINIV